MYWKIFSVVTNNEQKKYTIAESQITFIKHFLKKLIINF